MYANPSLKPLLSSLHFIKDDDIIGVFTPDKLITSGGTEIPLSEDDKLRAAHSYYILPSIANNCVICNAAKGGCKAIGFARAVCTAAPAA